MTGWLLASVTLEFLATQCRFPIKRVRFFACVLVLLPDLYRLVGFTCDETETGPVKGRAHDTSFSIEGTRLCNGIGSLKSMSGLPVPEGNCAIIAAREEDVVFVGGESVYNGIVADEVLHQSAFGAFELLY